VLTMIVKATTIIACAFLFLGILVNGSLMLLSPTKWLRLPYWARSVAGISPKRHSAGVGALQLRLTGAVLIGILTGLVYMMFFRHPR